MIAAWLQNCHAQYCKQQLDGKPVPRHIHGFRACEFEVPGLSVSLSSCNFMKHCRNRSRIRSLSKTKPLALRIMGKHKHEGLLASCSVRLAVRIIVVPCGETLLGRLPLQHTQSMRRQGTRAVAHCRTGDLKPLLLHKVQHYWGYWG